MGLFDLRHQGLERGGQHLHKETLLNFNNSLREQQDKMRK